MPVHLLAMIKISGTVRNLSCRFKNFGVLLVRGRNVGVVDLEQILCVNFARPGAGEDCEFGDTLFVTQVQFETAIRGMRGSTKPSRSAKDERHIKVSYTGFLRPATAHRSGIQRAEVAAAGRPRPSQDSDINQEGPARHRPVQQHRRRQAANPQGADKGDCLPIPVWHGRLSVCARRSPPLPDQ